MIRSFQLLISVNRVAINGYMFSISSMTNFFLTLLLHTGKIQDWNGLIHFPIRFLQIKSCRGFFVTKQAYFGNNGYSLKLDGVEHGINDNAYQRAIVLHGANYVSESFIAARGFAGRSEGCPAVPVKAAGPIINSIKDETCLFIYHPDQGYFDHSEMVH